MAVLREDYCILDIGTVRVRALRLYVDDNITQSFSLSYNVLGLDCSILSYATFINNVRTDLRVLTSNNTYIGDVNALNVYRQDQYAFKTRSGTSVLGTWSVQSASRQIPMYFNIPLVLVSTGGDKAVALPSLYLRDPSKAVALTPDVMTPGYITVDSATSCEVVIAVNTVMWAHSDEVVTEEITPPDTDPYSQGGNSSTGGGTGTFSETGDIIGIPGLPAISAVDTGFITLFNPTPAQVKQLANYMWSQNFDLSLFKNVVANPIDCILGLSIVPVDPPNAGSRAVTVGNIPTDVTLPYLSSQFVEVDCGTLNVQEFWGSYLDYSPYTKMSLYLPYIGIVPLDIDDVMNASIAIKYHVDVLSGACVAYVLCNGTQLYTYVGQCSANVPITSNDFTNTVNGILGIAGSIGSLFATGGASAPSQVASVAGNAVNALKPNIQKSGAMSGTGGMMGVQTPYLICQRPRQSVPESQNSFTGYPANITATLSDLSGYTEVEKIHLEGIPCTNEEMNEIMQLLESGVYI